MAKSSDRNASEITRDDYRVIADPAAWTLTFEGSMRLRNRDHDPIWKLMVALLKGRPTELRLDLRRLVFSDGSAINLLYRWVIELRKRGGVRLIVMAGEVAWQKKSLPNVKRLLPEVEVTWTGELG